MKKLLYGLLLCATPLTFTMEESKTTAYEWGLSDRQGRRRTMEDAFVQDLLSCGPEQKKYACFGLFDGHGGVSAAEEAAQYMMASLSKDLQAGESTMQLDEVLKGSLKNACFQTNEYLQKTCPNEGTTALVAVIVDRLVYLASVGDTRALIMSQNGTIKGCTNDHKPDSPREIERIGTENIMVQYFVKSFREQFVVCEPWGKPIQLGKGQKVEKRVARLGPLSVSRSLGDKTYKDSQHLIIANPDIDVVEVSAGDYLILACDGLWDVMSNERVAEFVSDRLSRTTQELQEQYYALKPSMMEPIIYETGSSEHLQLVARALRNKAYDLKSDDNISVVIIKL